MGGTGNHYVKLNIPDSERQTLPFLSHMEDLDLKNKMNDISEK
jgi:hypothetical protein